VTRRLRTGDRLCRTVVLRLRFGDFTRATRSHTLPSATDRTEVLLAALRDLLHGALPIVHDRGITLLGVSLAALDDSDALQLELPFGRGCDDPRGLDAAMDAIRSRYGTEAITRAVLLGKDPGMAIPILPD
jgi:DNA polymerase-4